jgi:uncharacterized membrane protein (UPF0127 family)
MEPRDKIKPFGNAGQGVHLGPFPMGVENRSAFAHSKVMNRWGTLALALAVAVCGGCTGGCRQAAAPAVGPAAGPSVPTAAQPKLQTMKLWLGAEEMAAELALTGEQTQTGMMFRTNLAENAGMLFVFPSPYRASFWMKNCPLPLSAAYIDPDGVILEIRDLQPQNTNSVVVASERVQYVLETNQGWFGRHKVTTGMMVRTERGTLVDTFFGKR